MAVILSKSGYNGDYISTGNEYISLPRINVNGGINAVGFFSNKFDASIEFVGRDEMPLIAPFININDENIIEKQDSFELLSYWIPRFSSERENLSINYTIITPITRKGFVCVLNIKNKGSEEISFDAGWRGAWTHVFETAKLLRKLKFEKNIRQAPFEGASISLNVADISNHFSLSMFNGNEFNPSIGFCELVTSNTEKDGVDFCYDISIPITLKPGERVEIPLYVGIAKKELTAISVAKELKYQGHRNLIGLLYKWLNRHIIDNENNDIKRLMNENSFYNFFYSQATTIDEDKLVITSARDSRSSHCGIYSDTDSMRWSQSAIELVSWSQASKHLKYAFNIQAEHTGQMSRSISGNILEQGIKLDAICSPIRALIKYIEQTNDLSILYNSLVQNNINYIQKLLSAQYHDHINLLETLVDPDDVYTEYPYICMQNVLVWRVLKDIGKLYNFIRDIDKSNDANQVADTVKEAILKYFVIDTQDGKRFAHAIDLNGNYKFGNTKALSLRLLPFYQFCSPNDPIYLNTLKFLNEDTINQPKNSNEVLLDLSNCLLLKDKDKADQIIYDILDNANHSENKSYGTDPYASLSGLITYSLYMCYNGVLPNSSSVSTKNQTAEPLYHRAPEIKLNSKKARIRG